ncbi:serine/threonine protein kinase [Intrasporangium oryzae NRRL B-24470]|uniref:Serine/threonine protein kinase n=1 Tax=Intrasporangium oryzae NRRL B-24470 TaxID=1386089 RepID=W9GB56_9MICO|nr:phosphotransferase [Intrasporangium oryzae]EWT02462.1 serine/threonine protein kinase [Intrasporangium oryzae NRRL B-24470]
MKLLASGRDSDVFDHGDGLVLRRYRDGRSAEAEAATIRAVAALGYPVPAVHSAAGPDIVMERVDGTTLVEAMAGGLQPEQVGAVLAGLHDRLHALDWPGAEPGESILHLDLHPLNVIVRGTDPVVIDWSNARPGHAGLDVAMTALILAQVVVTDGMLASVGVGDDGLRAAVRAVLETFAGRVGTPYSDHLANAEALRRHDPNQSAEELRALSRAVGLAREVARVDRPAARAAGRPAAPPDGRA